GCQSKKPGPITPLPGRTGSTVPEPGAAGSSTNLANEKAVDSTAFPTGIPQGTNHDGWTENHDTFKADTVHFDYDMAKVKSSEKAHVAAVADYLRANGSTAVKIEGHCDERGTDEYNRALGERRAMALREEIVGLGIDANRVDTITYGK